MGEAATEAEREVMTTSSCQNQITGTVSIVEGERRGERGGVEAVVGTSSSYRSCRHNATDSVTCPTTPSHIKCATAPQPQVRVTVE